MRKLDTWDSGLNVGVGLIDNQHKIILDLIKDLGGACEALADRRVIETLLDVLENYVFHHFEAEEKLVHNHATSQKHCLEHYGLIKDFRKMRLGFRNRNAAGKNAAVYLNQWFLTHITEHDIPLFSSIANGGGGQSEDRIIDEYPFEITERRRHKRIINHKITDDEIVAECYNTASLKETLATVLDISLGGLRLRPSEPYAIGDLLVVSCHIGTNFNLREKVRIVNVVDEFHGAEFINLSPAAEKFLIELYGAVNIRTT